MTYPLFHPDCRRAPPSAIDVAGFAREFPGESRHVEFKQGVSQGRVATAVAAFSNTDGGVLLDRGHVGLGIRSVRAPMARPWLRSTAPSVPFMTVDGTRSCP